MIKVKFSNVDLPNYWHRQATHRISKKTVAKMADKMVDKMAYKYRYHMRPAWSSKQKNYKLKLTLNKKHTNSTNDKLN